MEINSFKQFIKLEIWTKQVLDSWNYQIKASNKLINVLRDEQLVKEIATGKNRGTYLLAHMVADHDGMVPLLGLGEKSYPELETVYIRNPDKSGLQETDTQQLREYWNVVNEKLNQHFANFSNEDWFQRHTAATEEAFTIEPHRNKLNILISRTVHLAYHLGQMALLK